MYELVLHVPEEGVEVMCAGDRVQRTVGWSAARRLSPYVGRDPTADRSVRTAMVVVVAEPVELSLEIIDRGDSVLATQVQLEGLMEAFDLAAGLRVIRARVGVTDPERQQARDQPAIALPAERSPIVR